MELSVRHGSYRAVWSGNWLDRSLGTKVRLGRAATLQAVTRVKLEQAPKALCLRSQAKTSRNIGCSAFAIMGPAPSNGSRPSSQWWIATPSESVVPSSVPKTVVTAGRRIGRLIPIRRVLS